MVEEGYVSLGSCSDDRLHFQTCGHSRTPLWECRADLEGILSAGNMITVDPAYWLMPEANAEIMLKSIDAFWVFFFNKLEKVLAKINPLFSIDWEEVFLFGVSFGAYMALGAFLDLGNRVDKPPGLCIRAIVLRCPLIRMYKREPGEYMGIEVPRIQAIEHSKKVLILKWGLPFIVQRTGDPSQPWTGMFLAHTSSVAGNWKELWGGKSIYEMFEDTQVCPDVRTQLVVLHGTADRNVPHTDSLDFKILWESKGWRTVILQLQEEKPHAWDYNEPLSPILEDLLKGSDMSAWHLSLYGTL
jgi:hypothetical protein